MKICDNGHDPIVYNTGTYCPLCQMMKHIDQVHDFIESKGDGLVEELVKYQEEHKEKD